MKIDRPFHHLFYSEHIQGDEILLSSEETRHMHSVLRNREDDRIYITDGRGGIYETRLVETGRQGARAEVLNKREYAAPEKHLHCYVGIPDKDHFEAMVESLSALGVTSIIPVGCEYCQKRWWGSGWEKHVVRLRKKMVAGIKQALTPRLPELSGPVDFKDINIDNNDLILTADMAGESIYHKKGEIETAERIAACVGPPGGFSPEELSILREHNARCVSISSNRLRTELAAIVLCASIRQIA
ncbi:MAG: RsmE family RNA methyltransferase [Chitinivibrionales bacterium]|nr:RsmE family RNA methyltransferase [Chitinivibrionales bacterium]